MSVAARNTNASLHRPAAAAASTPAERIALLHRVLDQLDARDDKRFRNRRSNDRFKYRLLDVPTRIWHPGGSRAQCIVATRNLSTSGIGLLADRFLHVGTQVEIVLRQLIDQTRDVMIGKVVFCTHVSGTLHQVGVRFDVNVFPALYVDTIQGE